MIKEFQIDEILNAVDSISKMEKKRKKIDSAKNLAIENDLNTSNRQAKSKKSSILVLDQMIE
tara:strand:+ start:106 stop:291 length:186 start_codon:yes stop_codon:yes gene_type:complete